VLSELNGSSGESSSENNFVTSVINIENVGPNVALVSVRANGVAKNRAICSPVEREADGLFAWVCAGLENPVGLGGLLLSSAVLLADEDGAVESKSPVGCPVPPSPSAGTLCPGRTVFSAVVPGPLLVAGLDDAELFRALG
jgi:hypothetical protein